MNDVIAFRRQTIRTLLIVGLPASFGLYLCGAHMKAVSYLFGLSLSIINFYLLSTDITKVFFTEKRRGQGFLVIRYFLRYGVIAGSFAIAVMNGCHVPAFIIGFFSCQILLLLRGMSTGKGAL